MANYRAIVELVLAGRSYSEIVDTAGCSRALDLTNQGARNLIRDAARRGWVTQIGTVGRGGRMYWVARDIFQVIEAPLAYELPDGSP